MKKILLSIAITSIASSTLVQADTFRYKIPQPQLVTNDWDGDGEPNATDTDDDNDGILDANDDNPFSGRPDLGGSSGTGGYTYTGDTCEDGSLEPETVTVLNDWLNQNLTSSYYCEPTRVNWWIYSQDSGPIPEEIAAISQMEDLSNNGGGLITELPESIAALSNLRILNIRDQGLTSIPSTLGLLPNIERINFRNNQIVTAPDDLNNLPFENMTEFYLYGNTGSPFTNIDCSAMTSGCVK